MVEKKIHETIIDSLLTCNFRISHL